MQESNKKGHKNDNALITLERYSNIQNMSCQQEFEALPLGSGASITLSKVPDSLLLCTEAHDCGPKVLGIWEGWAVALECKEQTCLRRWYVCPECTNARRRLYTRVQLKGHKNKQHSNKRPKLLLAKTQPQLEQQVSVDNSEKQSSVLSSAGSYDEGFSLMMEDATKSCVFDDQSHLSKMPEEALHKMPEEALLPTKKAEVATTLGTSSIILQELRPHEGLGFSDSKSEKYFQNCRIRYPGETGNHAGRAYLVLLAHYQREIQPEDMFAERQHLPSMHVTLQMQIAAIILTIPRTAMDRFSSVLSGSYMVGCEDGYQNANSSLDNTLRRLQQANPEADMIKKVVAVPYHPSLVVERAHKYSANIPFSKADMNKFYTPNKFSILENLPQPKVFSDINGHAYLSIVDCIRDALGRCGARIGSININADKAFPDSDFETEELMCCQKAMNIYEDLHKPNDDKGLTSALIFWNDDCDPQSSAMQGRANVWLKTMTIAQPPDDTNRFANTYPIACGEKGLSHDAVEQKINDELEILRKGLYFYIGDLNEKVFIRFGHLANLADQPERRTANWLTGGGSTFQARTAISANHHFLYDKGVLVSCRDCRANLLKAYHRKNFPSSWHCDVCLNWDVLQKNTNELSLCPLPSGYPHPDKFEGIFPRRIYKREDGTSYMKPFRITYSSLKTAVESAHTGFTENGWTKANCKHFLNIEGINDKFVEKFQAHADRALALRSASGEAKRELLHDCSKHPGPYQQVPYPPLWDRVGQDLCDTIDALMHLVFLGIVNTTMGKIQGALISNEKNAAFIDGCSKYLKSILAMSLDWLKVRGYSGGKFYGWNSENYQGFARLMQWFYQNFSEYPAKTDPHKHAPPDGKPQKRWTVEEHKYWLKIRNLDVKGNKADLVSRVGEYMKHVPVPEPVPSPVIEVNLIEQLVTSLQEMLQCLMSTKVDKRLVCRTSCAIRIFLNYFDELDNLLNRNNKKPSCITSYNFICLMNLPEAMRRFGPLRGLWEGKVQGEGILRFVKPEFTQGIRKNWQANLLGNCGDTKSLKNIMEDHKEKAEVNPNCKEFLRLSSGMFKKYDSAMEVRDTLLESNREAKNALSVILVQMGLVVRTFAVVHDYETVLELSCEQTTGHGKFGLTYYNYTVDDSGELLDWHTEVIVPIVPAAILDGTHLKVGFGLLLPLLDLEATAGRFALITSNWRQLSEQTKLHELLD